MDRSRQKPRLSVTLCSVFVPLWWHTCDREPLACWAAALCPTGRVASGKDRQRLLPSPAPPLTFGRQGWVWAFHHEVLCALRGCWAKSFLAGPGEPRQGLSSSSSFLTHRDFGAPSPKALLSNHTWGSCGNFIYLGQGLGVREDRI